MSRVALASMSRMRVLMIGTGDAFTAERFGCSAVIEAPGGHVLVDCPDCIHRALREGRQSSGWDIDAASIQDIIITHLHGDHCNGLESVGFSRWLAHRQSGAPLPRLHCWRPVASRLWERLAPAMDQGGRATMADYFHVHLLDPEGTVTIAGMQVSCYPTAHPVPTVALRFHAAGRTLAWSSDTPFDPELIAWLERGAHLIIHETSPAPTHTPIEPLNALPAGIRSRMRLMHMPDDFDPRGTDIPCMTQGQVLPV